MSPEPGRRWYSVKQTASALGLHEMSVRKMIARGTIKAARIGRAVRVDFLALEGELSAQAEGKRAR